MKCCICNKEIPVELNGWAEGHNAEPVERGGRCCTECNSLVVIPRRINLMTETKRPH
ncbi:MAG: hypothetical protein ACYTFZ_00230 [Planctomycetota bacterium]|jgi:hypothetical protein